MWRYAAKAHGAMLVMTLLAVFAFDALTGQHQGTWEHVLVSAIAFCAVGGWRSASRRADTAMELCRAAENRAARQFSSALSRRGAELTEAACTCGRCHPSETNDPDHPVLTEVTLLTEHIETPEVRTIRRLRATMPVGAAWHTES